MRQENNRRKSSVKGENLQISNSRAMGVITLIALLFVFQVVTFVVQKVRGGVELEQMQAPVQAPSQAQEAPCRFGFNPNTISSDSLQLLGFSLRQAQTILNYRSKGGTFRVKRDFARMYVVDSVLYAQLAPYILLPDTLLRKNVQKTGESGANMGVRRKNVQEIAENSTNLGVQRKNVQEKAESSTNQSSQRKNVQKTGESGANMGVQRKNVQEIAENSTNLGGQRKNVQETGESGANMGVQRKNVQETGESSTNLGGQQKNVQEIAESGANMGVQRKNVQEKAESSTNLGGQRKNVQEIAENSTNLGSQRKNVQETGGSVYGEKVVGNRYMCNLNRADSAALVELYGIGGYYARKILLYRESLGGSFASERQLLEIEGFGQERFSKIENNVVVLKEDIKKFSLLDAGKEFLERHPYIGPYAARGILTYIRIKGRESFESNFQLLEELVKEYVITENNAQRIREYLLHL